MEYAPLGIRVNTISPGWIRTPLTAPDTDDPVRTRWEATTSLLGRIGNVDQIAMPTLFFVSDYASFINGATLIVGGFMTIVGGFLVVVGLVVMAILNSF